MVGVATGGVLAGCSGETGGNNSSSGGSGNGSEPTTDAGGSGGESADATASEATTGEDTGFSTESSDNETDAETSAGSEEETQQGTEADSGSSGGDGFSESYYGSGTSSEEGLQLSPGPILAEYSHSGDSNFIVTLVTVDGESYEDVYLSNEIGDAEGSQAATVTAEGEYILDVDADGDWELSLEQPTDPETESMPFEESGDGSSYIGPFQFDGPTTFQGSHDGESNFIVDAVPIDPSEIGAPGIFNEIGQFEGESTGRVNGVAYLNISADGSWTLSGGG